MKHLAIYAPICALALHASLARAEEQTPPETDAVAPKPAVPDPIASPTNIENAAAKVTGDVRITGSTRGVAEEFLVLPSGAELGGRLRTIMADDGLGGGRIKLTDVALLDLHGQWAFARHFELDASVSILSKQPSETSEHVFQGGSLGVRRDLRKRTALAVSGSATPLLGIKGFAFGAAALVQHKHRLNEIVTFDLALGANSILLRPTGAMDNPHVIEGAGHASVLVRIPNGYWGGWLGAGYALPVYHRGHDPISGMSLDPQPRLDLDIGTAVRLADDWDMSFDLSIIDRGDLAKSETRLPLIDGGFDQIQFMVGVSRRLKFGRDRGGDDLLGQPLMQL